MKLWQGLSAVAAAILLLLGGGLFVAQWDMSQGNTARLLYSASCLCMVGGILLFTGCLALTKRLERGYPASEDDLEEGSSYRVCGTMPERGLVLVATREVYPDRDEAVGRVRVYVMYRIPPPTFTYLSGCFIPRKPAAQAVSA